MNDFSVPRVTTRAMLDPTRLCHLRCDFCYYLPKNEFESVKPWEKQAAEVLAAKARGCDSADITGGDPLDNPHIVKLVRFCREHGIAPRIISSLIAPDKLIDEVMDAGVDDWLISMHGAKAETHNAIVHNPARGPVEKTKYRQLQIKRMARIAARMRYCCNYVIVSKNQTEMADWARWLLSLDHLPPKVCNFINYNVFPEWEENGKEIRQKAFDNVADIRIAGPILDEAIDILEAAGVGVNVRYYPYCGLSERHYKNVCNDLHVAFDQGEWDNAFGSRSSPGDVHRTYSVPLSNRNEEKKEPCRSCSHQWICGGANRLWHKFSLEKFGTELLQPLPAIDGLNHLDFWHYRQRNILGLDPRRTETASQTVEGSSSEPEPLTQQALA